MVEIHGFIPDFPVDNELERHVQTALETLIQGRTSLVIAHRLSTIERMDRIVVLQKGEIAKSARIVNCWQKTVCIRVYIEFSLLWQALLTLISSGNIRGIASANSPEKHFRSITGI